MFIPDISGEEVKIFHALHQWLFVTGPGLHLTWNQPLNKNNQTYHKHCDKNDTDDQEGDNGLVRGKVRLAFFLTLHTKHAGGNTLYHFPPG